MKIESLEIGELYAYMDIISMVDEVNLDNKEPAIVLLEYGPDFIGEGAIHIKQKEIDYWFVLHMVGAVYYYKLVYKK